jgi:hypothetical protein
MRASVHPSINKARINVSPRPGQRPSQYLLVPTERAQLASPCGRVRVTLDDSDDLPSRVVSVEYLGRRTELYSVVYNGKRDRRLFALT